MSRSFWLSRPSPAATRRTRDRRDDHREADGGSGQSNGKFPAVNQPGVTADAINVGGVASVTNPLGGNYGYSFKGIQAYFDMVNSEGGIYGRKLKLTEQRDDKLANNKARSTR